MTGPVCTPAERSEQEPARRLAGASVGLRSEHLHEFLAQPRRTPIESRRIGWLEVLIDNFVDDAELQRGLDRLRRDYALAFHSVSLNLGSCDPLDEGYIKAVRRLAQRYEPQLISDHLCWTAVDGRYHHDLLPLPYTGEALDHVSERVERVQDLLGCQLVLENVSSYIRYADSTMGEAEFLAAVSQRSGCALLVDVSNIVVVSENQRQQGAREYLESLLGLPVRQFHLGGYEDHDTHLLDSHSGPVAAAAWHLFGDAVRILGAQPTSIEWDCDVPQLDRLLAEADKAQEILNRVGGAATPSESCA